MGGPNHVEARRRGSNAEGIEKRGGAEGSKIETPKAKGRESGGLTPPQPTRGSRGPGAS